MKDKIITFMFVFFILTFSILHLVIKDEKVSYNERRKLTTFPEFKLNSKYITEVDEYLLDHFPFREIFRSIKANFNYNILNKLDNNGIYLKENYIFKSNYPTNEKSINNFTKNIDKLRNYFTENNNVYLMIIPDKNYYLNDNMFLQIDYNHIYYNLKKLNINMVDIRNIMSLNDYYETDTHWKQENLDKVVKKLSEMMYFDYKEYSYVFHKYDKFYGVYYGESAINRKPEVITYLTNDIIDNASVKYLENNKLNKVYNDNLLNGMDSYNVYLDGASSFIEITNNSCDNNRELVIFRDSFGSSLTPLLIPYYSKITLIDNRYINSNSFLKYIEFDKQDILFMYSTLLINDSYSLKG